MIVNASRRKIYSFGPYVIDPARLSLQRSGVDIAITPRLFSTLLYLVENAGHVVSKDEMVKAIWPGRYTDEANLTKAISTVRKLLAVNGPAEADIITIPGYGYRFATDVVMRDPIAVEGDVAPSSKTAVEEASAPGPRALRWKTLWIDALACLALFAALIGVRR